MAELRLALMVTLVYKPRNHYPDGWAACYRTEGQAREQGDLDRADSSDRRPDRIVDGKPGDDWMEKGRTVLHSFRAVNAKRFEEGPVT